MFRRVLSTPIRFRSIVNDGNNGFCSASSVPTPEAESEAHLGRRVAQLLMIGVTGGIAISGVSDFVIFYGCTDQALEKARQNKKIVEAIGEPIVRGPWYNSTLAVNQKRHSLSCTCPISGPQGSGILKLKAVQSGDENWLSFLGHRDWEILIMDAILSIPSKEGNIQSIRVSIPNNMAPPPADCKPCNSQACTAAPQK
ncbi:cytochrome oxidase complex assembly protein [Rhynchospora pubera]|uniref:Cytochrome oxidase complex assembly protein n=1 Tax=Rhynchospora pubera TaxID=906938 RepID=A0AAV8BVY3_9POAL|nr:cytochrome oxidase complex assembly protein [Rhynchospora pubera]